MTDGGIGRLLVASLHQAIADLLPTRLEFYEGWLNPAGLRDGRVGLAPLAAVLSFLRLEGPPYHRIAARAGEYTAEWTVAELTPARRRLIQRAPDWLRRWLIMRVACDMVRRTYGGSRAVVRWRKGAGQIEIRGSIFCEVREPVADPLCEYYAGAFRRLLSLLDLPVEVVIADCRATGAPQCRLSVETRAARA